MAFKGPFPPKPFYDSVAKDLGDFCCCWEIAASELWEKDLLGPAGRSGDGKGGLHGQRRDSPWHWDQHPGPGALPGVSFLKESPHFLCCLHVCTR